MPETIAIAAAPTASKKEVTSVNELVPSALRGTASKLISFIEEYYRWLSSSNNPLGVLEATMVDPRRFDPSKKSSQYLDLIALEMAKNLPKGSDEIRANLLNKLIDFYRMKGSSDSIRAFFLIFFDEVVSIYTPKVDLLKPSSGDWRDGKYHDRNGFLSDTKKIHDGDYWQEYSYEVSTYETPISVWLSPLKKSLHPAGMKLFGALITEIIIRKSWDTVIDYSKGSYGSNAWLERVTPPTRNSHTPRYQPGWSAVASLVYELLASATADDQIPAAEAVVMTIAPVVYTRESTRTKHIDNWYLSLKNFDGAEASAFESTPVDEIDLDLRYNLGTFTTVS